MSERASQMAGLVATIDPNNSTGETQTSDVIDASLYDSVLFILSVGAVSSSSGKIVLKVYEGTATGTVSTSVGATTWTQGNTSSGNVQLIYDLDMQNLTGPNYRYVKATCTVSGSTGFFYSLVGLGFKPRFHPASQGDLSSVLAIKTST
jgi:hypothetical protein